MFNEGFFDSNGIKLAYIEKEPIDKTLHPILFLPALPEGALDWKDMMHLLENRSVTITYRGREESEAPTSGYSLDDHAQDVVTILDHFVLDDVIIIAYSRGVCYGLEAIKKTNKKIAGLVLIDYPARHDPLPPEWIDYFWKQDHRGIPVQKRIPNKYVLEAIQKESFNAELYEVLEKLTCPILLLAGVLHGSKLEDEDIKKYKKHAKNLEIINFDRSDHDLRVWEYDKFTNEVKNFVNMIDYPHVKSEEIFSPKKPTSFLSNLKSIFNKTPGVDKKKVIKLRD